MDENGFASKTPIMHYLCSINFESGSKTKRSIFWCWFIRLCSTVDAVGYLGGVLNNIWPIVGCSGEIVHRVRGKGWQHHHLRLGLNGS